MNFCIQTIFDKNLLKGAQLVAGRKGLTNCVQWVNCMEILDTPESLQRGELLVTTGYRLDNADEYSDFMERVCRRGISGIAIQPGYYISKIPEYIIKEGDRLGLPVIELPSTLTFSSILHTLITNITVPQSDDRDRDYEHLLASFETEPQLFDQGVCAVVCGDGTAFSDQLEQLVVNHFSGVFKLFCTNVRSYTEKTIILFSAGLDSNSTVELLEAELMTALHACISGSSYQLFCGLTHHVEPESRSSVIARAYGIVKTLSREGAAHGICSEDGLPFFRWCRSLSQQKEMVAAVNRIIEPLQSYDANHKNILLPTLRVYLAGRGQITVCARILGIHRKTIKKRLERITELCKISPETHTGDETFSLALSVADYFIL